jgi:hypothetical protein
VRVHAPPGGKSNFSLGGGSYDDVPEQRTKAAFKQYDMNQGY